MINWTFVFEIGLPKWAARTIRRQIDKRLLRRDSRMVLPTGQPIILARISSSASEVYVTAADMDWGAEALLAAHADPAGDLLDVGAHLGYYSLYLAPLVRRAFAFEPDPRNHNALRANVALTTNVEHVAMAVSDHSGIVRLATDGDTAISKVAERGDPVAAVSIDDFVRAEQARPCVIKIDVEGHDLTVLEGARATLARWQPLVLTEFTQGEGDNDVGRLMSLVAQTGYAAFAPVWRPGRAPVLSARPRTLAPFDAALLAATRVKMILLVPPRLRSDFDALVGKPV